jgi:hypothetical protein
MDLMTCKHAVMKMKWRRRRMIIMIIIIMMLTPQPPLPDAAQ